jgi:hypothetical protein
MTNPAPAASELCLWSILVPTVRNSGKPYTTRYHRVWDNYVMSITGGLTIHHPSFGKWKSDKLYSERMIPVSIACTQPQIEQIADFTAKYYEQLAVMYWLVSCNVQIKSYDSKTFRPSKLSKDPTP